MTSGKGVDGLLNFDLKKVKKGLFNYGQNIVMAFSPPVVSCLVKKGLQEEGGSRAPRNPPGYAYVTEQKKCQSMYNTLCILLRMMPRN